MHCPLSDPNGYGSLVYTEVYADPRLIKHWSLTGHVSKVQTCRYYAFPSLIKDLIDVAGHVRDFAERPFVS